MDKSSQYAYPNGFWTLEVFHNGMTLIPEDKVECLSEPQLDNHEESLYFINSEKHRRLVYSSWLPVKISYVALPGTVGGMLIDDWEELEMVHHASAELTYWLNVDTPDRTWTLKDWIVKDLNMTDMVRKFDLPRVNLSFVFSSAMLTRH